MDDGASETKTSSYWLDADESQLTQKHSTHIDDFTDSALDHFL